jgi:hypothetical protein
MENHPEFNQEVEFSALPNDDNDVLPMFPRIRIIRFVEGVSCQFDPNVEGGVKAKRRWRDEDDVPHEYSEHKESNKKGYYVLGFVMRPGTNNELVSFPEWESYEDAVQNDSDKTLAKFHVDVEVVTPPIMSLLVVNQDTAFHDGWKVTREQNSKPERVPFFANRKFKKGTRVVKDSISNLACGEAHTVISLLSGAVYAWGEGIMHFSADQRSRLEGEFSRRSSALVTARSNRLSHVEDDQGDSDESVSSDMDPDDNDDASSATHAKAKDVDEEDPSLKHPDFTMMDGETAKHRGAGETLSH